MPSGSSSCEPGVLELLEFGGMSHVSVLSSTDGNNNNRTAIDACSVFSLSSFPWHHGGATVLLDWHFLNEYPELDRATSLSRDAFLLSYTPEVTILPLGIQVGAGSNGENSRGTVVGLLLHQYLNSKSSNFSKRVGVYLWHRLGTARRRGCT